MPRKDSRFDDIVNRYEMPTYRQALYILGDTQDAEEVTQDVLMIVYESVETFREEAQMSTWINRITANVCHSRRRKASIKFLPLEEMDDADQIPADDPTPEAQCQNQEESAMLLKLVSTLPRKESVAITNCYYEDRSYTEIGDIMRIPQGTVAALMHRGRLHLLHFLAHHEYWKDRP